MDRVDLSLSLKLVDGRVVERLAVFVCRIADVVAESARSLTVAVVVFVVKLFSGHVTCTVESYTAVDEVTYTSVDQRVVNDFVSGYVPCLSVTMPTSQAMSEHVVHRFVSQQEHKLSHS